MIYQREIGSEWLTHVLNIDQKEESVNRHLGETKKIFSSDMWQ